MFAAKDRILTTEFAPKKRGMMLIELLLTLALGLLLVQFLLGIYLAVQQSAEWQADLYDIEQNGFAIIDRLTTDIKKAGYIGCARLTADFPIAANQEERLTVLNRITGEGLERLTVRYMNPTSSTLLKTMTDNTHLTISRGPTFAAGDVLIIADCTQAETFKVKKIDKSHDGKRSITTEHPLLERYSAMAEIGHFEIHRYAVKPTKRFYPNGSRIFALYFSNRKQDIELVAGVHKLKLTYDVAEGGIIRTLEAKQITDWSKVVGVALSMCLTSLSFHKIWYGYFPLVPIKSAGTI